MDDINLTAESSFFAPNIHEYLEFFAFLVYIYLFIFVKKEKYTTMCEIIV